MLKRLTIQNYALIESLDIEFPGGLIIITGETGAGKSIMLGALSLLLGAKGDVAALKDSAKNCVVEGEFEIDGEELILRRVISPAGRTRNFINDEPATLSQLTEISSSIVDIHAQHQHLLLTNASYQMRVLDYFAGTGSLLERYRESFSALQKAQDELERLNHLIAKNEGEREYKEFQLEKLIEAKLVDGELEELELEQKQLANSEQIKESLCSAGALLQPMGVSVVQNLKEATHILQKCSNFVPQLEELCNRLESCRIECKDIEEEIESMAESVVISPQRLQQVDERIAHIYSLMRKHSVNSVAELLQIKNELEEDILRGDRSCGERDELEREVERLRGERDSLAEELSAKRGEYTEALAQTLQRKIQDLQMPNAIFNVKLERAERYTQQGCDNIEFLFSANGDKKLNLLQKAASGGELSRIMLCIKSLMAEYTGMPTMIFDEIDTGVSGSIADKMGALIGRMGEKMQIFAITHLPQIASKRGTHLLVYKVFDDDKSASTHIRVIEGQERVNEIARMLSGSELTAAAIENAKELLKLNNKENKN